jgi:hypothetical protein
VRPPTPPRAKTVTITLKTSTLSDIKSQDDEAAPYFLWGDNAANRDVFANKKPLPKGTYWLFTKIGSVLEKIRFTQTC